MRRGSALATRLGLAFALGSGMLAGCGTASADPVATSPAATEPATAAKKPTKAELGAMLQKCSDEADAKGLTVQKGKGAERKAYRRACMAKNGVMPRGKI